MGLIIGISGVIIALYAVYSGIALWMAQHVGAIERGEEPMRDEDGLTIFDHLPAAHIEIMRHYYTGTRGVISRMAFLCLIASLVAIITQNQIAVYLFGIALGMDCLLFLTYEKRNEFLSETTIAERLFDGLQYALLLGAFLVLVWRQYSIH